MIFFIRSSKFHFFQNTLESYFSDTSLIFLRNHIKVVHEGIKKFRCELCNVAFASNKHLKKHIDGVHKGLKEHKCDFCGKDYSSKNVLKLHIKQVHKGIKDYKCQYCDKFFGQQQILKRHVEGVHKDIVKLIEKKTEVKPSLI